MLRKLTWDHDRRVLSCLLMARARRTSSCGWITGKHHWATPLSLNSHPHSYQHQHHSLHLHLQGRGGGRGDQLNEARLAWQRWRLRLSWDAAAKTSLAAQVKKRRRKVSAAKVCLCLHTVQCTHRNQPKVFAAASTFFDLPDWLVHKVNSHGISKWLTKDCPQGVFVQHMTSFEKMSWFEYWKHAFLKVIRMGCKVLCQHCML